MSAITYLHSLFTTAHTLLASLSLYVPIKKKKERKSATVEAVFNGYSPHNQKISITQKNSSTTTTAHKISTVISSRSPLFLFLSFARKAALALEQQIQQTSHRTIWRERGSKARRAVSSLSSLMPVSTIALCLQLNTANCISSSIVDECEQCDAAQAMQCTRPHNCYNYNWLSQWGTADDGRRELFRNNSKRTRIGRPIHHHQQWTLETT